MSRITKYAWSDGMKSIKKILIGGINLLEKQQKRNGKHKKERKKQLKKIEKKKINKEEVRLSEIKKEEKQKNIN